MTATLDFWFIRHKPTGHVIHQGTGVNKTGGSWVEPEPATSRIRLFAREWHARAWLTRWLRGPETVGGDPRTPGLKRKNRGSGHNRRRQDMEIVKLEVTLP